MLDRNFPFSTWIYYGFNLTLIGLRMGAGIIFIKFSWNTGIGKFSSHLT
jgi:hypothetical protein